VKLAFTPKGWADYLHWQQNDTATLARVNDLLREAQRSPFQGIGKPEPLRSNLKGWWSRRITQEHRLLYRIRGTGDEQTLEIASCRFHYKR
jgi:toxin YoeB